MIDLPQQGKNKKIIAWAINYLSNGTVERYLRIRGTVTATVSNQIVIDEEIIGLDFTKPPHGASVINIYWEESGYKAYRNLGLYGQASSTWQTFIKDDDNNIFIQNDTPGYEIKIELDKTDEIFGH